MRTRYGEWLAGLLLAVVGVLFALVALEAGVRILHLVPDRFWEADPDLGVRLVAGSSGWWTQEDREFVVPIRINSHGLRDVEHSWEKPAGTTRVLVLGDSFVEALHVPLEATAGRQLETRLNAGRERRFEVISAGVSGYGTAAESIFFDKDLQRYQPDVVILAFYPGNDIKNNSSTLEDYLQPEYGSDGALLRIVNRQKVPRATRSKAFQFLRQTILLRQPALANELVALGVLARATVPQVPERDGIPIDYGVYATSVDPEWEDAWSKTEQLLNRLRKSVEDGGAHLVVMIVSTRDQIYADSWEQIVGAHAVMQNRAWDLDAPQRRVEAWCRQRAASCFALAPAFREVAAGASAPLHYRHDGHWTPAGHELAATVTEKYLRDFGL